MSLPLLGRRVHISGSIHEDLSLAPREEVELAREFVRQLVVALLRDGATFVVAVDEEKPREVDGLPICFDWLILETINANLNVIPSAVRAIGEPLIVAVQHAKNVAQIPSDKQEVWDRLNEPEDLLVVENAGHWSMNSKRLEIQAQHGDILIVLGGKEGVLHLANLYHSTGRPVIPLPFAINEEHSGARRLWDAALVSDQTDRFFSVQSGQSSHRVLNRLHLSPHKGAKERVEAMLFVLHALRKPRAFAVRLLNPKHHEFIAVETFFDSVVKPVAEEFGYELRIVDRGEVEESLINTEIFRGVHFSRLVIADITGQRPNCFIELGYALAQGYPVMICSRERGQEEERIDRPFDIGPVPSHDWVSGDTPEEGRRKFRKYWKNNIRRPRIVQTVPLSP